jgi:AAA+ superfamily predicted ATPase
LVEASCSPFFHKYSFRLNLSVLPIKEFVLHLQPRDSTPCPELNLWLLRLASDEGVLSYLFENPFVFGALYSSIKQVMLWPEDLAKSVSASKQKAPVDKDAWFTSRLADLAEQLGTPAPVGFASDLAESTLVLKYYRKHGFRLLLTQTRARLAEVETPLLMLSQCQDAPLYANLYSMGETLGLTKVEEQVLLFAILMNISDNVCFLFSILFSSSELSANLLPVMLDCGPEELGALMSPSVLVRSGMLTQHPLQPVPVISGYWTDRFVADYDGAGLLPGSLVDELKPGLDNGYLPSMTKEDREAGLKLLRSRGDTNGFNLLFYGDRHINKRTCAYSLTKSAKVKAFMLRSDGAMPSEDRVTQCYLAQQYIKALSPNAVLVVEGAARFLNSEQGFYSFSFNSEPEDDDSQSGWDALLLDENPVKTIWLVNAPNSIPHRNLSRFIYHFEVKKGTRSEHQAHLRSQIKDLGLSEEAQSLLEKKQGLSGRQIVNAARVATILGKRVADKEACLLRAVESSQKAMQRNEAEVLNGTVTEYKLSYLNTDGKFKPDQILSAMKTRPAGSLCLYGLPGTGKTQFAEKLATELDRPLLVRRASDLLSKWHGETEQQIARMFREAEAEEAVLFLDEADSFLRDRTKARESWQISQTNELLQCMERFKGVFICATNLFKDLDQAALRRFTFKLNFMPLTADMRLEMFLTETGLTRESLTAPELESWRRRLVELKNLTPGDFATVKRQSLIIGDKLSPEDWLVQLGSEVKVKRHEDNTSKHPPRFY